MPPVVPPPKKRSRPVPTPTEPLSTFAATELTRLQQNDGQDVWLRSGLLTALAERIRVLLTKWQEAGEAKSARSAMGALSTELSLPTADPAEVDRRWQRALETLTSVSTKSAQPRRAFWKR